MVPILVVKDNEADCHALALCLRQTGHAVAQAKTGEECIRLAKAISPALVLLDIKLPDLSGFEVCRALKREPATATIPVIQISAHFAASHNRIAGLESGAYVCLTAPVEPGELFAHVQALLRTRVAEASAMTERERSEEALRQAHDKLQSTLNSITDGLVVLDREWRYTFCSQKAANILGLRCQALLGKVIWDFFPHAKTTKFYEFYHRAVDTGQAQHFEEFYPEPLRQWLECHCYPSKEGLTVYFRDITDRKRVEESAAELQRKVNSALLAGEVATFEWSVLEDRLWGDRNFVRIFGIPLDAAGAAPLDKYVEAIHPEDRAQVLERVNRTVQTGCLYQAEYRIINHGQIKWVVARGVGERDATGRVVRFPGIIVDITERKHAEDALRQSEERYQRQVRLFDGIASTTPDFVYLFDLEGRFRYANRRLLEVWGMCSAADSGRGVSAERWCEGKR